MIRRDIPQIDGPQQRLSMLATLDHDNAVDFFGKKALEQDCAWVQTAMEAGAFNPSGDVLPLGVGDNGVESSMGMLDALLRFTEQSTTTTSWDDPVYGELDHGTSLIEIDSTDAFRDVYAAVVDGWIEDVHRLDMAFSSKSGPLSAQTYKKIEPVIEKMATKLMVGAVVIDAPDALESLAKAFPDALGHSIAPSLMVGPEMDSAIYDSDIALTPYGFALQYGRVDCMSIIESNDLDVAPIAAHLDGISSQPLNAAQIQGSFTPLCYPSVYADAIRLCFERSPDFDKAELADEAVYALSLDLQWKRAQMWKAYLDLDLYAIDAPSAFMQAVAHGYVPIVESFEKNVPWEEIDSAPNSSVLIKALEEQSKIDVKDNHRKALELMVKMAKADGALDSVFRITKASRVMAFGSSSEEPVYVSPITNLIDLNYQEILHEILKHTGFKPNDPPIPGAPSFQKIADERNESIADFLRSYTARAKAHNLIDEIDVTQKTSKAISP